MSKLKSIQLNNTFTQELPADESFDNMARQVNNACFSYVSPYSPSNPSLIHFSNEMRQNLGLSALTENEMVDFFSGRVTIPGSKPYAMCYGGHQFGNWAGQLGDGRAINLAEIAYGNNRWALQLKGAGPTPYSRSGDGFAVLRSSIREYLCSEAMHYLNVPTTRALSLVLTGDEVLRDMLYNGNPALEKGAIVCRVAPTFIRFGSFEIFAARQDIENLKGLLDYTIRHFYSHLGEPSEQTYLAFFKEVCERTKDLIIHWQRVGFVHGAMNTDNMSIIGQTIDYGPYGWLENFDLNWTPNTTDGVQKRYCFGNQPQVALWNLTQLANALFPLMPQKQALTTILNDYKADYEQSYLAMMCAKIGLLKNEVNDKQLMEDLENLLALTEMDYTLFFRNLSELYVEDIHKHMPIIEADSYLTTEQFSIYREQWKDWLNTYAERLKIEHGNDPIRKVAMDKVNPKYVLRNYMAQLAIDDADEGNYALIDDLFNLLKNPYDEQPTMEKWFAKRPNWAKNKVGCSMLSCSS